MLELIINNEKERKIISLVDKGKLIETYEENSHTKRLEGNIYCGTVKNILQGMQSAFIDIGTEKNGFIHIKDILPKVDEVQDKTMQQNEDIKKVIKVNDKLLVQVKKDSNDKKGARVSTHISIPSRYMVFMPNTEIITISKKIEEEKERQRLLEIVSKNIPKGNGAIIRTSAIGKTKEEIKQDIESVVEQWNVINENYEKYKNSEKKLIYKGYGIVEKIIIDMLDKDLEKIIVNSKNEYNNISNFLKNIDKMEKIKLVLKENENLIDDELRKQIEKLSLRKVWLNCGGFITIDSTEALTAIDVNTGKFTGKKELEDTIFKVNEEATIEIVKQLRLRDIGGIIIIDYIDMTKEENKQKIQKLLEENLKKDRAKTQVEGFTKLNLMEMTRKHICSNE